MRKVTIAAIQSKVSADIDANLAKTEKMITEAAKKGAKIICLQELFNIPYIPQKRGVKKDMYAESVSGKTVLLMKSLAKKLKVNIIVPFYEKGSDGKYYNTAIVFDENGKALGKYHKIHIPHDPGFYEKDYFEHGNLGYKVFKTKYAKIAVLICYDQWFPEAARAAKLAGAEIIFYPTAIGNILGYVPPEGDWHESWEIIQRAHAIANNVSVVAVNRTGVEDKTQFWGQSFAADGFGKVIKRASKTKEEVMVATLDLDINKFVEDGWGFIRNRRPDSYTALTTNKLTKKSKKLQPVEHYTQVRKILGEK